MHAGTAAAAAAGATGGGGMWLFSYNKENFGFDAGMRFGRFMMARGNANAQVGQYREDIEGIVGTTISKMDAWQTVTTLFLAVGAALSCAGRVGMHGCAPPGWFCALFSGSIFMSVLFNGTSLWLSMHAALRAQCAAVSLQTRQVRLPIPSMGQLDQARVFGSSFEKQEFGDIFRVPFMRHAQAAPDMPVPQSAEEGKKGSCKAKGANKPNDPTKEFASTARDTVPSWIRDEVVVEKGQGAIGNGVVAVHDPLEVPEHFKLLMKAQEEWRDYDVYARICMLYGVISFLYAVTYYAIGTTISELRGFWVMWTCPIVFVTAQALIMRLDILKHGQHRLPNAEYVGFAAPFLACTGCTLEYRYFFSEAQVAVAWGFALAALFAHFVMALRMLDLAFPEKNETKDMPEEPGRQWWPGSWRVPRAFTKHLWFITPPTALDPKVSPCLLHEMEDMAANGGGVSYRVPKGKKGAGPAAKLGDASEEGPLCSAASQFHAAYGKDLPWQITRVVILTAALQWFFVMITTSAEIILGPESLLKPPGEPPWIRDTKARHWAPGQVHLSTSDALPEGYRLFAASTANYDIETSETQDEEAATTEETHDTVETATETETETATETGHATATEAEVTTTTQASDHHRRLSKVKKMNRTDAAFNELLKVMPMLGGLLDQIEGATPTELLDKAAIAAQTASSFMAPSVQALQASFPALFEPKHVLCSPKGEVLALSPRGLGAFGAPKSGEEAFQMAPVSLSGLTGRIVGGTWVEHGLRLVTAKGQMMDCQGAAAEALNEEGQWECSADEATTALPLSEGESLLAAAWSEERVLAVVLKSAPRMVSLFRLAPDASWHPVGEVHVPPSLTSGSRFSVSFAGEELLMIASNGEVQGRHTLKGGVARRHAAPLEGSSRAFQGACRVPSTAGQPEQLIRLAIKEEDGHFGPELIATEV